MSAPAACAPAGVYKPRRPQALPLFRLVSDHFYYGYGRRRWGMGYGGDILTLILIIVLLWAVFGGRL